ncbi:MAG: hypothetical protein ACPIOQ_14840, partial [Promethearchaeia archaeon]
PSAPVGWSNFGPHCAWAGVARPSSKTKSSKGLTLVYVNDQPPVLPDTARISRSVCARATVGIMRAR